jgi:hypothetical protein
MMGGDKDDDDEYGGMMGMSGKGGKKTTSVGSHYEVFE